MNHPWDLKLLQQQRHQFPALEDKIYFNYGGQGPMPQSALATIQQAYQTIQQSGPFSYSVNQWLQQEAQLLRQQIATELGVTPETITLTEDVTVGCNIPLWGLAWEPGDHILMSNCEHPGIVAAVRELCRRFQLTMSIFPLLSPADPLAALTEALQPTTRLLVISHVLWNTGQVMPLSAIVERCRQRSVRVLVDAAQSVGMLPLNLSDCGADFYAFTGHKWWCGPAGAGGLYVRPDVLPKLAPTFIGWRGIQVDGQGNPAGWQPDGRRFEIATSDGPLWPALRAAIDQHHQWGTAEQRYLRICHLSSYLWGQLQRLPHITCLLKTPPESGLVSFQITPAGQPAPALHRQLVQALESRQIYLRTLLSPNAVRACTHYFTLESEIDRLVEAVKDFCQEEIS